MNKKKLSQIFLVDNRRIMKFLKLPILKLFRRASLLILTFVLVLFYLSQTSYLNSFINIKYKKNNFQKNEFFYDFNITKAEFKKEILVHIDLKGAPPKITYLLNFISFITKLGASGILIEYEDMFPYHNELQNISALNTYTPSDIAAIILTAEMNNLTVIPLVPTFSHFEFVLKLEQYKKFREIDDNPQILCPRQENVYSVLQKMIDQVLAVHNTSKYIHIGCDEAEFVGVCPKCQKLMRMNKWRKADIYFDHVRKITEYIMQNYPGIRPIMWGDEFTKSNEKILLRHRIPDLVDPMLWNKSKRNKFLPRNDMNSLWKLFKNIWIACAFKGVTSTKIVTDAEYHLQNTDIWIEFVNKWKNNVNFKGIAVTGWQRYHHFTVLCELLPVAIPSLALNLLLLKKEGRYYEKIKKSLNCSDFVPINLKEINDLALISRLKCDFPGFKVYHTIHSFFNTLLHLKAPLAKLATEDFLFYNIFNNVSNPAYVKELNVQIYRQHLLELNELENDIRKALKEVYDEHTINEWIMTYMAPVQMRLEAAINIISTLSSIKVWPRRPLINNILQARKLFDKICSKNETMGCAFINIR